MSNVVEYILSMKDYLSPSVATASRNAINRLNDIERAAERIPSSIQRTQPSMASSGTSLGKIFSGSFLATAAFDIVSGLGSLLKTGVTSLGGAVVDGLFKKERAIAGLETFLGRDGASELYKQIQQDAAATPFGTEGLLEVNKALVSAGLNAKQARTDTLALANAVSAAGGENAELSRMAANMQQIKTVGVATAMDIKQFGIAGINIYQLLADATGKNINEVKEMNVSYELLASALQKAADKGGLYYGAMDRYAKTIPGMWDAFQEGLSASATNIGTKLEPAISGVLKWVVGLSDNINSFIDKAEPFFNYINNSVLSLVNGTSYWSSWLNIVIDHLSFAKDVAFWIAGNFIDIVKSATEWVKQSVFLRDLFSAVLFIGKSVYGVVGLIVEAIKGVWDNVVKPMLNTLEVVYRLVKEFLGGSVDISFNKSLPTIAVEAIDKMDDKKSPTLSNTNSSAPGAGISGKGVTATGPKQIVVNINKEMIGALSINSMNIREGVGEMENMIKEVLYRTLLSLETVN